MDNFDLRKYLKENKFQNEIKINLGCNSQKETDMQDTKNEIKDFYDLMMSDDDVKNWLQSYHYDRIKNDPSYDSNLTFNASKRENLNSLFN